ncbi:energy transducer TonB [Sphingosinithalassobacter portus]|uniref:energy transducer TonB n=1 Tax=Stakelama portus TaxID=2676234 RepID=UPI000D6E4391|nr:energy transducer TonB [Sphingosinithalassobacter portus]
MHFGVMMGLSLAILAGQPETARDPEILQRAGPWNLHYDEDACYLIRSFGEGRDQVTIRMAKYGFGDTFDLLLVGSRFRDGSVFSDVRLAFGTNGTPFEKGGIYGTAGDSRMVMLNSVRMDGYSGDADDEEAPPITAEQEAAMDHIVMSGRHWGAIQLQTGPLDKPMAALRQCVSHLVEKWGYDPEVITGLSRQARKAPGSRDWLLYTDYPDSARMRGQNGSILVRLDVDATGKVTGCKLLENAGLPQFGEITCRRIEERAVIEPALDANGNPVPDFIIQRVNWQMGRS